MTERDELPVAERFQEVEAVPVSYVRLYGRARDLEAVLGSHAPVLLLTGDSGIGKSELLRAAQAETPSIAAPPPRTVRSTSGSLQRALLEGLSEATAELARERGLARQVGERFVAAGKKLVADKGREAGRVLAQAVLLKVKEKVGGEAVELMTEFIRDLGEVEHETLLARLNAATDEDVADTILDLAAEVADLAGPDTPIVIGLDGAEALTDDDCRLLGDLSTRLPTGVFLRVGFATFGEAQQARVEDLLAVGEQVQEYQVPRLSTDAIRQWLEAEGQDPQLAQEVYENTDGYALDVGDAIQQLAAGGALTDVEPSQKFKMRSRQAWRALDGDTQAVARQLVVFEQPIPEERLQQACGLTAAEWGAAVERLHRARVLSSYVNGVPWFHPKRRRALLDELRETERPQLEAAAGRAISAYLSYARTGIAPEVAADIAILVPTAGAVLEGEPGVAAALALDRQQLAVAAAVIDAFETRSYPLANAVLQHARDFFAGEGDLIPALEALVETGLVVSHGAKDVGGFLSPNFESETAQAVIQGRTLQELGRLPLPGLASAVFNVALAPRLSPYLYAVYGLGPGSIRGQVETATAMGRIPPEPFLARGQGHFVIVRARFHDRPVSATVSFSSAQDLDGAVRRLDGLRLDVLGGALEIVELLVHPSEAVAADRFVGALGRAMGWDLRRRHALRLQMEPPYDPDTYMSLRVATFNVLSELATEAERRVFGLEQVPSIHWHLTVDEDVLIQGQVYGGEPRAVRHEDVPVLDANDLFTFFRYAEAFGLAAGERLSRLNVSGGRPLAFEPVAAVIDELRNDAREITKHQARLEVEVGAEALQARLLAARTRELSDARALAANGPLNGERMPEPEPRATYVSIHRAARPGLGGWLSLGYLVTTSSSGKEEVHVSNEAFPGFGTFEEMQSKVSELFGIEIAGEVINAFSGDATQGIAELLGYHENDIVLVNADGMPADAF